MLGVSYSPTHPTDAQVRWVDDLRGTARIWVDDTFEARLHEAEGAPPGASFLAVTPMELDLVLDGQHWRLGGSLTWTGWGTAPEIGYRELKLSPDRGIGMTGYLNSVTSVPADFGFACYLGGQPVSTYFTEAYELWTKDAWVLGDQRFAPCNVTFQETVEVADQGGPLLVLGAVAFGGALARIWRRSA